MLAPARIELLPSHSRKRALDETFPPGFVHVADLEDAGGNKLEDASASLLMLLSSHAHPRQNPTASKFTPLLPFPDHACHDPGCSFIGTSTTGLCRHKKLRHATKTSLLVKKVNVVYQCSEDGCEYKAKTPSMVKGHKMFKHDIGVTWFACDLCSYSAKQSSNVKKHKAQIHDVGVVWYMCGEPECNYKAKQGWMTRQHKAYVHNIGVSLVKCEQCDFTGKTESAVKRHSLLKHEGGEIECEEEGCSYKNRVRANVKKHFSRVHAPQESQERESGNVSSGASSASDLVL